jgi:drug/metabolite transporter (DMT)-like permease
VSRSLKAHILLILVTFIWGATFVVIKNAITDMAPLLFNAIRMSLATVLLLGMFRRHAARLTRPSVLAGLAVGVSLWVGFELQTTGLQLTTPSKSGFLTGASVALVPLFLALFWGRRINRWTTVGVIVAFAGLYLMSVPAGAGSGFSSVNRGDLLTIGCAVAFAFQIIYMGKATAKHPFQQIAVVEVVVCTVLMWISVPVVGWGSATWSARVVWGIVITGTLCTALGFSVQAWAQQFTPPTHTALIFALEPVFAWMTSYVVLGERLGARSGAGAAMILAGVLLSELKGGPEQVEHDLELAESEERQVTAERR